MEIAHDFLKSKQHGRDRRVEGRCQCGGRTDRKKRLDFSWTEMQPASQNRSDAGSDMDRGTFTAKRDAACKGRRRAKKLAEDRAERDLSIADEQRRFRLRYPASSRIREVSV